MATTAIIHRKNITKGEFAVLSQEEVLSPAQKRILARAERNFREGKSLSLDELRKKLGFKN